MRSIICAKHFFAMLLALSRKIIKSLKTILKLNDSFYRQDIPGHHTISYIYLTFGKFQPCLIESERNNTITNPAIKATAPLVSAVGSRKT